MTENAGLDAFLARPLAKTLWGRRTHRVSRGSNVDAKTMNYVSKHPRAPLSELEEAILIAATGATGLTMPDRPFIDAETGAPIMAKPNLTMTGRTAGSPDNAQGTYFIMLNDAGTWFLRPLDPPAEGAVWTPESLIGRARAAKVQLLDRRIDVPGGMRDFPAYLDSNRFLSNLPGTTVFFPVVDLSHQYINGLMYLLTQPAQARPVIVDDRNFYRPAGVKTWIKSGFLNPEIKVPLGAIQQMRTQIEADLLVQNLFLVTEAMGLGAWIHGSMSPPVLMGDPKFTPKYGNMLGFDFVSPPWKPLDIFRWQTLPIAAMKHIRTHPVALRHLGEYLIQAKCPPNYASMSDAFDSVIAAKFGPGGIYKDKAIFGRIYKGDYGDRYLAEAAEYAGEVIACAKAICNYIHDTHGRFPAHCDALFAPGIWIQAHHVELDYYDAFFRDGLTDAHRAHDGCWHG